MRRALAAGHLTEKDLRERIERRAALEAVGRPIDVLSLLSAVVSKPALAELTAFYWKAIEAAEPTPQPSDEPIAAKEGLGSRVARLSRRPRVVVSSAATIAVIGLVSLVVFWPGGSSTNSSMDSDTARIRLVALLATPPGALLPDTENLLAQVASLRGETEAPLLRELANAGPDRVRLNAARLLALLNDAAADTALEPLLRHSDELTCLAALDCSARREGKPPVDALLRALMSERSDVRCFAARALEDADERQVVDALAGLTDHADPPTRAAVVRTLLALRPSALDDLDLGARVVVREAPSTREPRRKEPPTRAGDSADDADTGAAAAAIAKVADGSANDRATSGVVTNPPSDPATSRGDIAKAITSPPASPASGDASPSKTPDRTETPTPTVRKANPPPAAAKKKTPAAAKKPPPAIQIAKRDAPALLRQGKPGRVLELVAEAMDSTGDEDAELFRLRGRAHLALGSSDEALADFQRAIDLAPDLVVAYFDLATCYGARKSKKNAYTALVMALRFGFRDIAAIRNEPRLDPIKGTPAFRTLMQHYFHSPLAADEDDAKRFEYASRRLQTTLRREKDPFVRALAVVQFPEPGGFDATELLFGLISDRELIVRRSVAELLGRTQDAESIKFLCDRVAHAKTTDRQREALMWSLRAIRGPGPTDAILLGLADSDHAVRMAAARAIGEHPDRRAVAPLIELIDEVKEIDRLTVIESLGKITGANLGLASVDWRNWWKTNGDAVEIGPVRNPCSGGPPNTIALPAAYSERTGKARRRALQRYGGSLETEKAVEKALEWLARHQSPDGRWDTDEWAMRCSERDAWNRVTKVRARAWDVQVTGLALMAFLGAGHTHVGGEHNDVVRRGLGFLQKRQRADGYFSGDHHWRRSHEIATIAMAEAYLLTRDCRLLSSVQRAVGWVLRRQHLNGGWGWYRQESYTSLTGWNLTALLTANEAGLQVPASSFVSTRHYLDRVTLGEGGKQKPGFAYEMLRPAAEVGESLSVEEHDDVRSGGSALSTTVGLWCRVVLGQSLKDARVDGALAQLRRSVPRLDTEGHVAIGERLFFGTQSALIEGRATWKDWNRAMKTALLGSIETEGCERGSWAPSDDHGRVYSTALGALMLESYYRFHVSSRGS